MGQDCGADGCCVVVPTFFVTPEQSEDPLEERDRSLYAGPEALSMPKGRIAFAFRFLFRPFTSFANGYRFDDLAEAQADEAPWRFMGSMALSLRSLGMNCAQPEPAREGAS